MNSFSKVAIAAVAMAAVGLFAASSAEAKCSPIASSGKTWEPRYVYFDTGRTTLKADAKKTISEQAKLAKAQYVQVICLTGTADKKGDPKANQRLSQARANAVAAELKKNGVTAKIETDALGEPGGSLGRDRSSGAERSVEIRFTK